LKNKERDFVSNRVEEALIAFWQAEQSGATISKLMDLTRYSEPVVRDRLAILVRCGDALVIQGRGRAPGVYFPKQPDAERGYCEELLKSASVPSSSFPKAVNQTLLEKMKFRQERLLKRRADIEAELPRLQKEIMRYQSLVNQQND
jgi:hypothetical protein